MKASFHTAHFFIVLFSFVSSSVECKLFPTHLQLQKFLISGNNFSAWKNHLHNWEESQKERKREKRERERERERDRKKGRERKKERKVQKIIEIITKIVHDKFLSRNKLGNNKLYDYNKQIKTITRVAFYKMSIFQCFKK